VIIGVQANSTIQILLQREVLDERIADQMAFPTVVVKTRYYAIYRMPQDGEEANRSVEECRDIHGDMLIYKAPDRFPLV
jgi:hypothetical protein